ncbi:uncharacterized protein (TIGR00369 family) [Bradyrhizobium sp. USDA 4341]
MDKRNDQSPIKAGKDVDPNKRVSSGAGLEYFKALIKGTALRAPMLELFDINFDSAEPGAVVISATPTTKYYSPLEFVHGGYAAVLLDTCMAAAIISSLEPNLAAVTLEYKINFVRPMSADTGAVRGEGKSLYIGRQMAIAEGRLLDAAGRILAHGTTTCHVLRRDELS